MTRSDTVPAPGHTAAVVLAGGQAHRFGTDKLDASVAGQKLLERAICQIPSGWTLIVVGPPRNLSRAHIATSEQPPGGGPAAGLVAGAQAARRAGATTMATLPGDAPAGGAAAVALAEALHTPDAADPASAAGRTGTALLGATDAVVAIDGDHREQPLHIALTGAALDRLASLPEATDRSARSLVARYGDYRTVLLEPHLLVDLDTPEQAAAWANDHAAARTIR